MSRQYYGVVGIFDWEKKKHNQGACQALRVWKFESVARVAFYQQRAGWLVVENLWAEVFTYNFVSESQLCESTA